MRCSLPPSLPPTSLIDSPREQVTDAVAIYFMMPTQENVSRVCEDCRAQLYDKYYLNFTTAIPRDLLEELAKASLEASCVPQIAKVGQEKGHWVVVYPLSSSSSSSS